MIHLLLSKITSTTEDSLVTQILDQAVLTIGNNIILLISYLSKSKNKFSKSIISNSNSYTSPVGFVKSQSQNYQPIG